MEWYERMAELDKQFNEAANEAIESVKHDFLKMNGIEESDLVEIGEDGERKPTLAGSLLLLMALACIGDMAEGRSRTMFDEAWPKKKGAKND